VLAVYFVARFDSLVSHPASPDPHTIELNCIVQGDETTHVFPVKIAGTESMGALKDYIKDKNKHAFEQVDAKTLNLWKVSALYRRWFTPYCPGLGQHQSSPRSNQSTRPQ